MDLEQETLKWRIRRLQKRLREQASEIRVVTAKNHATAVNTATLDLRVATRATRTEIDKLVSMAGKGTLDSYKCDCRTGGSLGRWETLVSRPPLDHPTRRPSLPPGNPPRTKKLSGETQETTGEMDPLWTIPQVKSESPKTAERPWVSRGGHLQPPAYATAPTEVPSFNPTVPPHRRPS